MRGHRMFSTRYGMAGFLLLAWLAIGSAPALAGEPAPISGSISADNGHFEPFAQDGNVVYYRHEDIHELTGDIEGTWVEVAIFALDVVTGEGFFMAEGTFTGTVFGVPGEAKLRVHSEVREFFFANGGHFILTQGRGGLAGVHALGTFSYTVGVGGLYAGLAQFDERRE